MLGTIAKPRLIIIALLMALAGLFIVSQIYSPSVYALDEADTACTGIEAAGGSCGAGEAELNSVVQAVINILLYVIGIASVIVLIVGGIRYVVSGGDQQAVAGAKNTIIYAIVGLIVAVLAYAAVNYVFSKL